MQEFIYRESGIVLEAGKHYLVDARLSGLTRENGLESLDDLCVLLRATPAGSLGRRVVEHVRFMAEVGTLPGTSAEAREKAVDVFYQRLFALEKVLGQTVEELRLG